jgi:transposase-like protein
MGHDTHEVWSKRVERWKDSGLSAGEFAAELGINPRTLSYWRWRLRSTATKSPSRRKRVGFVEVVTAKADGLAARRSSPAGQEVTRDEQPEPLEVILRDVRIKVPVHFDTETFRRVVAVLGAS